MTLYLQIWGSVFYLANKYFFSKVERSDDVAEKNRLMLVAWIVFILGVPAWVIVFISEGNWIAAAVESSAVPAMMIGIVTATKRHGVEPKWLKYISHLFIACGLSLSLYEFGGLASINQTLELGVATGFLFGTYHAAKGAKHRYYWFVLGNISCATLMARHGHLIMMTQQMVSLVFVFDAHMTLRRKSL
jgi:hypothetical protein